MATSPEDLEEIVKLLNKRLEEGHSHADALLAVAAEKQEGP